MYYIIKNNNLISLGKKEIAEGDLVIEIIPLDNLHNFRKENDNYSFLEETLGDINKIEFPKTETYNHYYYITLPINKSTLNGEGNVNTFEFVVYILKEKLVFLGEKESILLMLRQSIEKKHRHAENQEDLVTFILLWVLNNELSYIEVLEEEITMLESEILTGSTASFNKKAMKLRKKILFANHYYEQVIDLISELSENSNQLFADDNLIKFENLLNKAERLSKKTEMLQDYTLQLREMYQSQIDIEQNKVMQVLTVVTTIFAPLTLITGWFGMNFEHMAFLKWQHAYPITMLISLMISLLLILYFKKKKYF